MRESCTDGSALGGAPRALPPIRPPLSSSSCAPAAAAGVPVRDAGACHHAVPPPVLPRLHQPRHRQGQALLPPVPRPALRCVLRRAARGAAPGPAARAACVGIASAAASRLVPSAYAACSPPAAERDLVRLPPPEEPAADASGDDASPSRSTPGGAGASSAGAAAGGGSAKVAALLERLRADAAEGAKSVVFSQASSRQCWWRLHAQACAHPGLLLPPPARQLLPRPLSLPLYSSRNISSLLTWTLLRRSCGRRASAWRAWTAR